MSLIDRGRGQKSSGKSLVDRGRSKPTKSTKSTRITKPHDFASAVAWAKKHPGQVQHHGGWHNPLTSAYHDVVNSVAGLPSGILQTTEAAKNSGENFVKDLLHYKGPAYTRHAREVRNLKKHNLTLADIEKALIADYKYRWGPLFAGHPELWAKRFSEHPVYDLLDIGTVASGLVGGATKAGLRASSARDIELATPAGRVLHRPVHGTELSRALKAGADKSLKIIYKNTNRKGVARKHGPTEWNRAAKLEARRNDTFGNRLRVSLSAYGQATEKLDTSAPLPKLRGANKQLIASQLRQEFVTRQYVEMYAARLRSNAEKLRQAGQPDHATAAEKMADLITQDKVLHFIDEPTPKMLRREQLAKDVVVPFREDLMAANDAPLTEARDVRPYQSLLILHGAKFEHLPLSDVQPHMRVTVNGREGRIVSLDGDMATVKFNATKTNKAGKAKKVSWEKEIPVSDLRSTERKLTAPPGKTIEGMISDIQAGLPEGRAPIYQSHEMGVTLAPMGRGMGGSVQQGIPTRQNLGSLFEAGLIAFSRDLLGRGTQRLIRWATYIDRHDSLVRGSRELAPGARLPKGWQYVKETRGQRIPFTQQHLGEFEDMLDSIGVGHEPLSKDEFALTTENPAEAVVGEGGGLLAVPQGYADRIIGGFVKDQRLGTRIFNDVTSVWRALVLNLRPAWLVNNIVGNTLLYTIQNAGKQGLRNYLSAVLETGMGPNTLLSKILRKEFRARIPAHELADILPDQVLATFMGTQMPEGRLLAHTLQHRYSPARWARNLDQNYEKALRKAIADRVLTRNPMVKRFYEGMPAQERSWMAAIKQAVEHDAELPERVTQEINAALGDFSNMSAVERGVIRGFVPFYAWYRAITVVLLKMPLDSPYRTTILANMGKIGQELTDEWWRAHGVIPENLPLYLRSVMPVGESAYRTTGLNPGMTTPQLLAGVADPGNARDLLGSFNPVIFAPLEGAVRAANRAPWEGKQSSLQGGMEGFLNFLRFLPEARLVAPYKPKLSKGGGTRLSEFANYAGWTKFRPDFEAIAKRYNGG